ncbi:MAG: RidA family protein [Deltaproteobacteria bacterium]|nr:RidA family protein [Deltaproteobacteria bacterium]
MNPTIFNPEELGPAKGYSNGVVYPAGRMLFVAGQVGWDAQQRMVSDALPDQFAQALDNILTVVRAAGGTPESIGRFTIYVTDKAEYVATRKELGAAYRTRMGRHFPAMALVVVAGLLEDGAKVEIEATAVLGGGS